MAAALGSVAGLGVFGVAGSALVDQGRNVNARFAKPSGDWGSLPLEGGIEAAYRRKLAAAEAPYALRSEILAEFDAVRTPFRTPGAFDMEEIIDPRDTLPILVDWVRTVGPTFVAGTKGRGFGP